MSRLTFAVHVVLLAICFASFSTFAQAQYRTSIQGVVADSSGAVVPGATLTLINPATNERQVRTSDANGVYNFNALAAAPFRLEVEKTGFQKKVLDHLVLVPEQANALNVQLDVGTTSQTVNVDASSVPLLETETASVNGVITDNQIQHMPSFGRDVTKLAQLAPGAFGDGSQGANNDNYNLPGTQTQGGQSGGADGIFKTENGVQVVANGNQTENNGISIDGISTVSSVWGGSTVITPSEDSIDNVKVVSNSYDAEDGRFAGAQIQITSKSGTNQFHGSLFFTTHQPNLNAYQPYNTGGPVVRDDNKFDQFGGSVGGPIWKNKVFFFFNYETVREPISPVPGNGWFDTPAFDALATPGSIAATYLNFPGNGVVTTGISSNSTCTQAGLNEGINCVTIFGSSGTPVGINVGTPLTTGLGKQDLTWMNTSNPGVGSGLGTTADLALYSTINPTKYTAAQYNGRVDADVTSKDRIGGAIYWTPSSKTDYNGSRGYDLFHHNQTNDAFSAIWNHTISSSFLNELRANAAGYRWNEISDNPQSPVGFPVDNIGKMGAITPNQFGPTVGSILDQWTYSFKDVATKIIGRNTLKFGGEATRLFYLQNAIYAGVPHYNFFNMWDFLNDAPFNEQGTFSPTTGIPTTIRQDDRENILGFFVQDDVKLRPTLTINLGLRWSYFGPLYSKEDNMLVADPGAGANFLTGLTIKKGDSWNAEKDNFGPQIGFAWSPAKFNSKIVFRGGYGLSYNGEQLAISSNIVNNPGLAVSPSFSSNTPTSINPDIVYALSNDPHNLYGFPANPNTVSTFGANGLPTTGGQINVDIFPSTLPTTRVHHYSFDMQDDLGHQLVMTVGYQGSLSRDIYFHENPNAAPAAFGYPLNPQIGGGDYWNLNGWGNYNALLAELKHNFSRQFMADAQFEWSKSLDTSSAPYSEQPYPYDLHLDYGRSDYNISKAFKLYGLWQPVFFHGNRSWIDKIAGGWTLSGIFNIHSGFPWTAYAAVNGGNLYCGTCGYGQLLPAAYLGGAGTSTNNNAFRDSSSTAAPSSNFPLGGTAYFTTPTYTAYSGTAYGNSLPQAPGVERNSLNGAGYKDVDATISKGFGLPNNRILGENAKFEVRMDVFNLFNNLNYNENGISNTITNANFGIYTAGNLSGRVVTLTARFSF